MPQTFLEKLVYFTQMFLFGVVISLLTIATILSITFKKKSK